MKIDSLFPVQKQAIPFILSTNQSQSIYPNDICVTAPTGSGKTLTYVLPLVHNLKTRIRPACRAIVLLPVSDLAEQVYNVFKSHLNEESELMKSNFKTRDLSETVDLKVMLLSNKNPFAKEQSTLANGKCPIDIIVATPGRLVDHIQKTAGFDLTQLRYLILDECDRIMDQIKQNWLPILNQAVFGDKHNMRQCLNQENLNAFNLMINKSKLLPLQKLLFSATLTKNPEKLEQIDLFQPVYISVSAEKLVKVSEEANKVEEKDANKEEILQEESTKEKPVKEVAKKSNNIEGFGEIDVPEELNEIMIQVVAQQKPLVAIYLLKTLGYRRMLCFVKSKETASRLSKLFELNGITSMEYSASLHAARRKRVQLKFEQDKLDVLVCSDVMARGMDLSNVDYVLLYDAPHHLSSYVHKVGRTARAGRTGTAITLLEHKEIYFFKKMMKMIGNNETQKHKIKEIKIQKSKLKPLADRYKESLLELKKSIQQTKKKTEPKEKPAKENAENGDEEEKSQDENESENKKRKNDHFSNKNFKKIKK